MKDLKELLEYDKETGVFTWKVNRGKGKIGKLAGCIRPDGYIDIRIRSKHYLLHRLAWFFMTGLWPDDEIDHINGEKTDNRWINLRQANRTINSQNTHRPHKDNYTGMMGVSFDKRPLSKPWHASIQVNKKKKHLGRYATPEEAHIVYLNAKRELHDGCTI